MIKLKNGESSLVRNSELSKDATLIPENTSTNEDIQCICGELWFRHCSGDCEYVATSPIDGPMGLNDEPREVLVEGFVHRAI